MFDLIVHSIIADIFFTNEFPNPRRKSNPLLLIEFPKFLLFKIISFCKRNLILSMIIIDYSSFPHNKVISPPLHNKLISHQGKKASSHSEKKKHSPSLSI